MYSIIRIVIGCVFLVVLIKTFKRSNKMSIRTRYTIIIGTIFVLLIVLAFLPFENLFITFDTPTKAFEYYTWGDSNIELIVEGSTCDFVVDCKRDADTHLIVPKTTNGWKIGLGSNTKKVAQSYSNGVFACVYQYKNSNDYFITIFDVEGGEVAIWDDYNSMFYSLIEYNDSREKNLFSYYAYIPDYNSKYNVVVNGNKLIFED